MKTICVIGLGYIGLPMALLLSKKNRVVGYDTDITKITNLKKGICPFKEKKVKSLYQSSYKNILFVNEIIISDVYIICVPTPVIKINKFNYKDDLRIFYNVISILKSKIKKNDTIIIESTCPPGTADKISKMSNFKNIDIVVCPEKAIPGMTIEEMTSNDRVIGVESNKAFNKVRNLYNTFNSGEKIKAKFAEAELSKLFENTFRDVNIALANEFDEISNKFKSNYKTIRSISNLHPRVNLHESSIGVGGHCIPVDPWFLGQINSDSIIYNSRKKNIKKEDITFRRISHTIQINKIKKLLLFGITYKPNTDDLRNSPAKKIADKILKKYSKKLDVTIFDPFIHSLSSNLIKKKYDLMIILVKHDKHLNKFKYKKVMDL